MFCGAIPGTGPRRPSLDVFIRLGFRLQFPSSDFSHFAGFAASRRAFPAMIATDSPERAANFYVTGAQFLALSASELDFCFGAAVPLDRTAAAIGFSILVTIASNF
jgi:hypothetical protein